MATTLHPPLTVEEYLAQEVRSDVRHEFMAGEVTEMFGGKFSHYRLVRNLLVAISVNSKLPAVEAFAEILVKIPGQDCFLYPDLAVVTEAARYETKGMSYLFNPAVIIEVLSESTEQRDRNVKFGLYRQISGFRDYLLVSQAAPVVEHWHCTPGGDWELQEITGLESLLEIKTLGLSIPMSAIYDRVEFAH